MEQMELIGVADLDSLDWLFSQLKMVGSWLMSKIPSLSVTDSEWLAVKALKKAFKGFLLYQMCSEAAEEVFVPLREWRVRISEWVRERERERECVCVCVVEIGELESVE